MRSASELNVASGSSVIRMPALHPKAVFWHSLLYDGQEAAPGRRDGLQARPSANKRH